MPVENSRGSRQQQLKDFKRKIYAYSFFEGLIFWYSIEKLFQQSLGFSVAAIVIIGMIVQAGRMVFEIPSSILADRWHRRNTLLIASGIMIVSSSLIPFVNSPLYYTLVVLLWTIYISFKSGTDSAFIYDSLKYLDAKKHFKAVYARYSTLEYASLIFSSFAAGVIANLTDLRVPFWLTTAPILVGMLILLRLPEPPLIRQNTRASAWWLHIQEAWVEVRRQGIVWVVTLYSSLYGLLLLWYEFHQLYGIAVGVPKLWFGSILATLCLGLISGSELVRRYSISRKHAAALWIVLILAHLSGLIITTPLTFLFSLFVTFVSLQVFHLNFNTTINDSIASKRRATILSVGGTGGQILFLGLALAFRSIVDNVGAPTAFAICSLPFLSLGVADIMRHIPWLRKERQAQTLEAPIEI